MIEKYLKKDFDWLKGIEKGSEFWPKNLSFSIGRETTSID